MKGSYLGPEFTNMEIENVLKKIGATYTKFSENEMIKITSEELAKHLSIYSVLVLRAQSLIECHLRQHTAATTWKLANQLVSQSDDIKDLFDNLDVECGSLTQQSSLGQLVGYVEMALQRLPRSP